MQKECLILKIIIMEYKPENERNSGYYDTLYKNTKMYQDMDYTNSDYYPIWKKILEWLDDKERIAEFGCGSGQFGKMCLRNSKNYIFGCDFSREAINYAKMINETNEHLYHIYCIISKSNHETNFPQYDTAIILEVLEHLQRDLDVIGNIPSGKRIIFSVPNFTDPSHVRWFNHVDAILERYGKLIKINQMYIYTFPSASKIFVCDGIKL